MQHLKNKNDESQLLPFITVGGLEPLVLQQLNKTLIIHHNTPKPFTSNTGLKDD